MNAQRFSGQRLTRQRKLVLEVVSDSQEHLDAETIYQLAKERDENISLATVYRALAYLKATGLIQEHNLGEDHGHFESAQEQPHYHFICKNCGRVIEFEAPLMEEITRQLAEREGVHVTGVHLLVSGECSDCAG